MTTEPGDLLRDIAATPDPKVPGRYRADLPDTWNVIYAFGGVTMAAAVAAARQHVDDPRFVLRSATATFLSPVSAGPLRMDVRTLRAGRGSRQLSVDLCCDSAERPAPEGHSDLHLVATFAPPREIDTQFTEPTAPEVRNPDEIQYEVPESYRRYNYHRSVDVRHASGSLPWDPDFQTGPAKWAGWFRCVRSPRAPDGTLDPIGYIPASDILGPAMLQRRGPDAPRIMVISLELSVHFLERTRSEWLLQQSEVFQAGDGYASGMVHLWDEDRHLVATGIHRVVMRLVP